MNSGTKFTPELDFKPETNEALTAYSHAKKEWDESTGSLKKQKDDARKLNYILALGLVVAMIGLVYLSIRTVFVPFYVEVEGGKVNKVERLTTKNYKPKDHWIKNMLAEFVDDLGTVSSDKVIMQKNYVGLYNYVTKEGEALLTNYIQLHKGTSFEKVEGTTVTVKNVVINKIIDGSFQVEWQEVIYKKGIVKEPEVKNYNATFSVITKAPETEKEFSKNHLGLFVNEFHISEKYY